jgi:hypothetical protein
MGKNSQTAATKKPDSDEESGNVNFFVGPKELLLY